jgi:hypothetical protein
VPRARGEQDCRIETTTIVGPNAYFISIIDILQGWDWSKR